MMARDEATSRASASKPMLTFSLLQQIGTLSIKILLDEKDTLKAEADKLMADRKKAVQAIKPEAMKTYNSLRKSKANRPVAGLDEGACTVCGIEQNNAIISKINRDDSLVYCHNCGRILVRI